MTKQQSFQKFEIFLLWVRQFKMKWLRFLQYAIIGLCLLGSLYSFLALNDHLNTRNINQSSDEEFWKLTKNLNISNASAYKLDMLSAKALKTNPPHIEFAENANTQLLAMAPNCLDCYVRIIEIDKYKNNKITEIGLSALSRTYELSPYGDLDLMKLRLSLSERQWSELNPDLQKAALQQITAIAQQPEARNWLLNFNSSVRPISERVSRLQRISD